jgi:hypothetical protein
MANRKNTRRNTRRNRRNTRRNMRRNRRIMCGGAAANSIGTAPVDYRLAGSAPSQMSLAQGQQYESYHMNQHGGQGGPYPSAVLSGGLPQELHASARILPLDGYFNDIRGLKDPNQMGAGRRRRRAGRKSRKGRKGRKGRKSRRNNMMGGAAVYNDNPASTSAPGLLLDPALEAKAIRGMNPEWYLAEDPNSFAPKS